MLSRIYPIIQPPLNPVFYTGSHTGHGTLTNTESWIIAIIAGVTAVVAVAWAMWSVYEARRYDRKIEAILHGWREEDEKFKDK